MTAALVHTSSRQAAAALAVARIAAAGRVRAERLRREAAHERAWTRAAETGQLVLGDEVWCYVCGRSTDHIGEHSEEQIAAYKAR